MHVQGKDIQTLHMGATRTAPSQKEGSFLCKSRATAPPMDSPYKNLAFPLYSWSPEIRKWINIKQCRNVSTSRVMIVKSRIWFPTANWLEKVITVVNNVIKLLYVTTGTFRASMSFIIHTIHSVSGTSQPNPTFYSHHASKIINQQNKFPVLLILTPNLCTIINNNLFFFPHKSTYQMVGHISCTCPRSMYLANYYY